MGSDGPSWPSLLWALGAWQKETNPHKKKSLYNHFRQGLDILDLNPITYEIIATNPVSMGYWLPAIAPAAQGIFQIPDTQIARVPLPLLQLTRHSYMEQTPMTLDIVDEWARKAFGLVPKKDYFVKTGTYSSKFDFRNAHVTGPDEVKELGRYLLFIHAQALSYAHYDVTGQRGGPGIYGMSTTVEWVVRDFIPSKEKETIYHGLPLRTEFRAFADFDTKEVLSICPYWEPETMKHRFENASDSTDPDMIHDSLTYRMAEPRLMAAYDTHKNTVQNSIKALLNRNCGLTGQWSIDIILEGDKFWLIDMAPAELSAFYTSVPKALRRPMSENWVPTLPGKSNI